MADDDLFAPRLETDTDIIPDFFDGDYFLLPGDSVAATINDPFDVDAFGVDLEAGETYIVSIVGIGPDPLEWAALSWSFSNGDPEPTGIFFDQSPLNHQLSQQSDEDTSITLYAWEQPFFGYEATGGNYLLSFIKADTVESDTDIVPDTMDGAVEFDLNGAVVARVNEIGDKDYFKLNIPPDSSFVLSLYAADDSGALEPTLAIFTETGDLITNQSTNSDSLQIKLSDFGEEALIIRVSSNTGGTGEYILSAVQTYDVVADGPDTTATVDIDAPKGGSLETAADEDWYRVALDSSINYNIEITGAFFRTGLDHPEISIYDADGSKVVEYVRRQSILDTARKNIRCASGSLV